MAKATSVFEKQAATYLGPREKLIPQIDRFYGVVPEAVGLAQMAGEEPLRILDLGAERMDHDHLTPLSTQLRWLDEIGFTDIDCLLKDHGFAVFTGRRP